MKILIIIDKLLNTCGVSSHCYNLISELKNEKNIEITILCGGGDSIEKFRRLGVDVKVNGNFAHENRSYLNYLKAIIYLIEVQKKNKYDIIHSHHHYAASIAYYISKLLKVKTILTNHGILPQVGKLNHFMADYIIVVNDHVVDYLFKNNIKDEKHLKLIRYGILCNYSNERPINEKLKIICASRLVFDKGVDIYLNAVNLLSDNYLKKAEFYFAGEGEYKEELLKLNKTLGSKVKYLGNIKELKEELSKYDIFIMPSRSTSEGFPLTIIEAGFAKTLLIVSNFLGVTDIFKDKEDGLVFEQDNSNDLMKKIQFSIDHFPELNYMKENFFSKTSELFELNKMVIQTTNFYNSILRK